jgi:hypothetical protein
MYSLCYISFSTVYNLPILTWIDALSADYKAHISLHILFAEALPFGTIMPIEEPRWASLSLSGSLPRSAMSVSNVNFGRMAALRAAEIYFWLFCLAAQGGNFATSSISKRSFKTFYFDSVYSLIFVYHTVYA